MRDIDEIAEKVDDYIIFWSEGGDKVADGEILEWNFVRHGGERGVLERQRKRALVKGIIERGRDEGWSQIRKEGSVVGKWREDGGEEKRSGEGEGGDVRVEFIGEVKDGGAVRGG